MRDRGVIPASPGSGGGFTAACFSGTTNITAAVVAATYRTASLARGATATITLRVTVGASVAFGTPHGWVLRQSNTDAPAPTDPVKATVSVN